MLTFTAQIIYRIECENILTEQYEEQWRLIFANDENDALSRARMTAQEEETTFIDRHGRAVCWKLLAIKDLQPVHLENGALLFSTLKEVEPVAAPLWKQ